MLSQHNVRRICRVVNKLSGWNQKCPLTNIEHVLFEAGERKWTMEGCLNRELGAYNSQTPKENNNFAYIMSSGHTTEAPHRNSDF